MPRPKPQRAIGGEVNLAQRIRRELAARSWTPAELARQMTSAGCSIGTSSVYKILDEAKPRTISLDEFISLATVFGTTTEDLLTPVEVLDTERAKELLVELDAADKRMIDGIKDSVNAHIALVGLRGESPELWDYVVNHHYRPSASSRMESAALTVVLDDGTAIDVDDTIIRDAVSNLYEAIIRQAAAAYETGIQHEAQ